VRYVRHLNIFDNKKLHPGIYALKTCYNYADFSSVMNKGSYIKGDVIWMFQESRFMSSRL
jgi:hypothetical protein